MLKKKILRGKSSDAEQDFLKTKKILHQLRMKTFFDSKLKGPRYAFTLPSVSALKNVLVTK
jgi:hypothetical protein